MEREQHDSLVNGYPGLLSAAGGLVILADG